MKNNSFSKGLSDYQKLHDYVSTHSKIEYNNDGQNEIKDCMKFYKNFDDKFGI